MAEETPKLPPGALPPTDGADYAKRMLATADGNPPTDGEQAPQLLAGKFKTQDELVKAYEELQKKLGQPKPPTEQTQQQEQPKKPATDPNLGIEQKAAEQAVENAGLDWNALTGEWQSTGQLADESYAKLEKSGIPRAMVDQFIEGQVAVADRLRGQVFETVGGQDKYKALVGWAAENLDKAEIDAFNTIAGGRDMAAIKMAVAGLKARRDAAEGSEPNLIGGESGNGEIGYQSTAELTRDMADPRYKKDPAFRKQVENKLRVTRAF